MDAGSGINLIYAKTLKAMHISLVSKANRLLISWNRPEAPITHWVKQKQNFVQVGTYTPAFNF
jgi:hypothetical protein